MPNLAGKTALVTGASRGMGRASALALAADGAQVLVHYGRGAKEADAVVAEIRKAGGRADALAVDLAAADGAHKLAKQSRSIIGDRLDILVANAGISRKQRPLRKQPSKTSTDFSASTFGRPSSCSAAPSDPVERKQHHFCLVARGTFRSRYDPDPGLCRNQGRYRHVCEALRRAPWRAGHPRQCGGPRRRRH